MTGAELHRRRDTFDWGVGGDEAIRAREFLLKDALARVDELERAIIYMRMNAGVARATKKIRKHWFPKWVMDKADEVLPDDGWRWLDEWAAQVPSQ